MSAFRPLTTPISVSCKLFLCCFSFLKDINIPTPILFEFRRIFFQCGKADLNNILYSCFINEAQAKAIYPEHEGISSRTAISRYWFTNSDAHI